ncbi:MAG TPA: competence/damage-inducible protein A [Verrucomicrobiota bacterium]|nr:competence/damage-inducible protein A [Verrucomicrobiota bacterium]
MIVELINTGSELMLGRVLNTHQQWLCRRLTDQGYTVSRQVAVPDTGPDIRQAVGEALARADLVITTGGLGPTSDDLTRDLIAQLLGKALHEDAAVLAHIRHFFECRRREMPARNRVQALVPAGAIVLPNPHGTAPGLAMEVRPNPFRAGERASWLVMLPGPPVELHPMFAESVLPLLRRVLPPSGEFVCRILRTTGIGESAVQEQLDAPLRRLVEAGLDLGYCARPGRVDVRLAARGSEAEPRVASAETIVRERLGSRIYGVEGEDLETVVVRLLAERKATLALAESCTGGCLAHRVTNVPGASAVFLAGLVTYSNAAKQKFLEVRADTLARHGAVSEPVAREMADGVRRHARADYALSVTGIAGPGGGTPEKPVGTVFIGLATPTGVAVERRFNPGERETFKQVTAEQALDWLRRTLLAAAVEPARRPPDCAPDV